MYPGPELLQEVGRVTIAGSRLDLQMGLLWHHLDPSVVPERARRTAGWKQREEVRRLANERLTGPMQEDVLAAVTAATDAHQRRNDVVHQDWVLRGMDATRPVAKLLQVPPEDRAAYLAEWERESKPSENWHVVPRDSVDVFPAPPVDELVQVERALAEVTDLITELTGRVASSRGCGQPPAGLRPPRLTLPTRCHLRYSAVLRVAWTLSDLAGRTVPGPDEVAEALGMRLQRVAA